MPWKRLPPAALAACFVGLVLCPFGFIAGGALSGFSATFSRVLLPPFLLACGFLLRRLLARPGESMARQGLLRSLETTSWLVVVSFLYLVSGANLAKGFERFGGVCTCFLATSAAALPFVLLRPTSLEMRLSHLPRGLAIVALIAIVCVSTVAAIAYLAVPSAFVG
jgi:hypothetical protein